MVKNKNAHTCSLSLSLPLSHIHTRTNTRAQPPVGTQSIISTHTSSPSLARSYLPCCQSLFQSVSLSLSHASHSVQSASPATAPRPYHYLSLLVYTTFLPSISHLPSPTASRWCAFNCSAGHPRSRYCESSKVSSGRRATRHRSHLDPNRTSSSLQLTA